MHKLHHYFFIVAFCASCSAGLKIDLPAESHETLFPVAPYVYEDPVLRDIVAETGIPPDVVFRLLESESSLRPIREHPPNADGTTDYGWSGVNSAYLGYFTEAYMGGEFDPYSFVQSFRFAARYLAALHALTGCIELSAVAYKVGPARIDRAPERIRRAARYVAGG